MNIKSLGLLACLLGLAVTNACARDMTIVVPVKLVSNFPAGISKLLVMCQVGVGALPSGATWTRETSIGSGSYEIGLSKVVPRNFGAVARVEIRALDPARSLDEATHYKCRLATQAPQPALPEQFEVSGSIPR